MLTRFAPSVTANGRPVCAATPVSPTRHTQRGRAFIARAENEKTGGSPPTQTSQQAGTVFHGGISYTEEQWKDAVARKEFVQPPPAAAVQASTPSTSFPTVEEVMGFSGAPEIINGRLAMLGFVAALGAELSTGDTVLKQFSEEPTLITLTFIIFAAASLVPAFARKTGDALGPFTPYAEMLNGRAAMIGFAAMLVLESIRGVALF